MIFFHNVRHSVNHVLYLLVRHGGIKRKRNQSFEVLLCHWKITVSKAKTLLIGGHIVNRNEVDTGADISFIEFYDELVAINGQKLGNNAKHIQMPTMCGVVRDERRV